MCIIRKLVFVTSFVWEFTCRICKPLLLCSEIHINVFILFILWLSSTIMRFHFICIVLYRSNSTCRTSLVAPTVKNLPAMQETWARSLGWEDPLEKGMATHSSILAWRTLMDKGAWWATVHGVTKSGSGLSDYAQLYISYIPGGQPPGCGLVPPVRSAASLD